MAILPSLRNLLIPNKTKQGDDYQTDMQQLEIWARQPIQKLVAGTGITLTPSSGLATDGKGNGPFAITIAATGGGVTHITSPKLSITITNPTGPTVDIDIAGIPFLNTNNYADANDCVAYGFGALGGGSGVSGTDNTAVGFDALGASSTSSGENVGVGFAAGENLVAGAANVAVGYNSLSTADNSDCTAVGMNALLHANNTAQNTAVGQQCLNSVTSGNANTGLGTGAGVNITTGQKNTVVGASANVLGGSTSFCTVVGYQANCAIGAGGGVAIGIDHTGTPATAQNQDDFVLGTSLHVVQFLNNHTGSTTTTLGTNSPASGTTPQSWIKIRDNAGNIGYIPYWV